MEVFTLAWRFLLNHQAAPYLVPLPGHLLALLFLLGLLAAVGAHHLVGYTYGFYRVAGRPSRVLAFPSLLLLLVSMQVLLAAYLLATTGPGLVRATFKTPWAAATSRPIGGHLLSPAFHRLASEPGQQKEVDRLALGAALLTFSGEELQQGFQERLEEARTSFLMGNESRAQASAGEATGDPAETPSGQRNAGGDSGETSSGSARGEGAVEHGAAGPAGAPAHSGELVLLTLHWLAGDFESWPPVEIVPAAAADSGQSTPAGESSRGQGMADEPEKDGPPEEEAAAGAGPDASAERRGPELAPTPSGTAGETAPREVPPQMRYLLSLIAEIPAEVGLSRSSWEHIAGSRFQERVLEPMITWQVRYLATLAVVLVFVANLLGFFALRYLRRGLAKLHARNTSS